MRRAIFLSLSITVLCSLPVFLLGALSIQMREELAYSVAMLGVFIAVFRGSGAIVAIPLGRLSDRLGPSRSVRLAAVGAAVPALGVATLVRSWPMLVAMLVVAGMANALGQASANLVLAHEVGRRRQGIAFGMKQSALPISSLLAGLAVPALALTVGWRWAFALLALGAITIAALVGSDSHATPETGEQRESREDARPLRLGLLAVGMAFAMAAATTLPAFTVESAVAAGISAEFAGLLLTAGSLSAVAARLVAGVLADRRSGRHLRVVSRMIAVGVVGYVVVGFGSPWTIVAGTIIGFAFGWGYNGVFWFATVRLNREAPGRATGAVLVGGMVGGLSGPMVFGWIADSVGYGTAWRMSALFAAAGAFTLNLARRRFIADRLRSGGTPVDP